MKWNSINKICFKSHNHLFTQIRPQTLMRSISRICNSVLKSKAVLLKYSYASLDILLIKDTNEGNVKIKYNETKSEGILLDLLIPCLESIKQSRNSGGINECLWFLIYTQHYGSFLRYETENLPVTVPSLRNIALGKSLSY